MENGQVDAAVMLEPDISVLAKRIGHAPKIIADVRTPEGLKEVFGTSSGRRRALRQDRLAAEEPRNRQEARCGDPETLQWISDHSGEEIAAKMPQKYAGGDEKQYAKVIGELKKTLNTTGEFTEEGAQAVLETQRVANPEVGDKEIDLSKTYTNEYLK
ncbi:hypothetical protein [Arthrobacter sp.]|uniref:hypothetical protein n=1 Tax=Arthrobacter sp. TaxID=1667 RepID=UPI003A8D308E